MGTRSERKAVAAGLRKRHPSCVGRCIAAALAVLLFDHPALAQDVSVTARGEHDYELRIVLPEAASLELAQGMLWPHSHAQCVGRIAQFGKYRFEAIADLRGLGTDAGPAEQMVLVQELACVDAADLDAREADTFVPAPASPPTAGDEAAVRDLTLQYLSAVDEGRFDDAFAVMSASFRPMMTDGNWRETRSAFNAKTGAGAVRQVVRLTWYDDPAGAPVPGRYVAADYRGDHANGAFYCGYLMWLLQADGGYRLVRSEEGMLSRDEARRIPAGMRGAVRKQLQCRD